MLALARGVPRRSDENLQGSSLDQFTAIVAGSGGSRKSEQRQQLKKADL